MLYDGAVTMSLEGEEPYQYLAGEVVFAEPMAAWKWTTIQLDDKEYSNISTEGEGSISVNFYTEDNDMFVSVYDTGELESEESQMSAGDHAVKIVQDELTFTTIFSGNVTLVLDGSDASASLDLSEYPADLSIVSLTIDGVEVGRGMWEGSQGAGEVAIGFTYDGVHIIADIMSSESDSINFANGQDLAGTHNIVIKASQEVYNPG